jgi:hypothetical protein
MEFTKQYEEVENRMACANEMNNNNNDGFCKDRRKIRSE